MKRILVPIDGSAASLNAARKAVEDAKLNNGEIIFVSVVKRLEIMGSGSETGYGYSVDFQNLNEAMIKDQTLMLGIMLSALDLSDISYEKKVLVGNPSEEILKYAEDCMCDLIVIGRRGFSKFKRPFQVLCKLKKLT